MAHCDAKYDVHVVCMLLTVALLGEEEQLLFEFSCYSTLVHVGSLAISTIFYYRDVMLCSFTICMASISTGLILSTSEFHHVSV